MHENIQKCLQKHNGDFNSASSEINQIKAKAFVETLDYGTGSVIEEKGYRIIFTQHLSIYNEQGLSLWIKAFGPDDKQIEIDLPLVFVNLPYKRQLSPFNFIEDLDYNFRICLLNHLIG